MTVPPSRPKIYHITHLNNIRTIAETRELVSDAERIARGLSCLMVGMSTIKRRRLEEIEVSVHPGTKVGEYVPFYFCPRSIMLYILHKANNPYLTYRGGQEPIVHLEADLDTVIAWANSQNIPWAFTDRNAGTYFVEFYSRRLDLSKINWKAITATDFRDTQIKEGKQAEFLTFGAFPWTLIEKIGTINSKVATIVKEAVANNSHQPVIKVERGWYF